MKRLFRNETGVGVSEGQLKTLTAARTKVFVLAACTAGEAAGLPAHGIKNL